MTPHPQHQVSLSMATLSRERWRMWRWRILACLFLFLAPWGMDAAVIHVDSQRPTDPPGDGLSWDTAFHDLGPALEVASEGDELWVAAGTYRENLTLKPGVALYGGFNATEMDRSARDWDQNVTILDGGGVASVVMVPEGAGDTTRLDGFTVRNGSAAFGGGLLAVNASPVVANTRFLSNAAASRGGAIHIDGGTLTATDCLIRDNAASSGYGGAISSSNAAVSLARTLLQGNQGRFGGALYLVGGSLELRDSQVLRNATSKNGVVNLHGGDAVVERCRFVANQVTGDTAGSLRVTQFGSVVLRGNLFLANIAQGIGNGGAAFTLANGGQAVLENNTILWNRNAATAFAANCAATATWANNLIAFNSQGLSVQANAVFSNNCFHSNGAAHVTGATDPVGTAGNVAADPLLTGDLKYPGFHLQPGSPCIDAGDPGVGGLAGGDLDGQPRVQGERVDIGADESGMPAEDSTPRIVRVRPDGEDGNDGSTWDKALRTVQAAILRAGETQGEVWVAAGRFPERIQLMPLVYLYGGFAGQEESITQRDWKAHASTLDGERLGTVVTLAYLGPFSRLDGFVVQNGLASDGGGILCSVSDCPIVNNVIVGNTAEDRGGGLSISNGAPWVAFNVFATNQAQLGGGIHAATTGPLKIQGNIFRGNAGRQQTTRFVDNGGGAIWTERASADIANNLFDGNEAASESSTRPWGGALLLNGSAAGTPTVRVVGNTFLRNRAPTAGSSQGGAIGVLGTSVNLLLANNLFAFNSDGLRMQSTLSQLRVVRNCWFANDYSHNPVVETMNQSLQLDPRLAAPFDVHLQSDSPCLDAGDPSLVDPGWLDLDGTERIHGTSVDIGADEFDGRLYEFPTRIVRVSPEGEDGDGTTWASAKRTVQGGIDAAAADGGEVWVKAGLYRERVQVPANVRLYGGFGGTEDERSQADWGRNHSVLDGEHLGSVISVLGGGPTTAIVGFTIRNGAAPLGGGVLIQNGSPLLAWNRILGNQATNAHSATFPNAFGGGVHIDNGQARLFNNVIAFNQCLGRFRAGAGVYCYRPLPGSQIINNTLVSNGPPASLSTNVAGVLHLEQGDALVANNVIAYGYIGINGATTTSPLSHNLIYLPEGTQVYKGITGGSTDLTNTPALLRLADPNFAPRSISPCLDAGDDSVVPNDWLDIRGRPRVVGAHIDIGAVEDEHGAGHPALRIVRVSPDGNDENDGSAWSLAKQSLQAAIEAASEDLGEVWVKAGTYVGTFDLRPAVSLFGGFSGHEQTRDQAQPHVHRTVLDGNQSGSVVRVIRDEGFSGIAGFTIRNGRAARGAGLYLQDASTIIANNRIVDNTTVEEDPIPHLGSGAGIFCTKGAPLIVNNIIARNVAVDAGNQTWARGVGIYLDNLSTVLVANNTIVSNRFDGASVDFQASMVCFETPPGSTFPMRNNIVVGPGTGIYGSAAVLGHNCIVSEANQPVYGPTLTATDITVYPLLVYEDDVYRLQAESPCRDAGDDTVVQPGWLDMDDGARIQGPHVDIGAHEFVVQETWLPWVPQPEYLRVDILTMGGITYARSAVDLPDSCHRLQGNGPLLRNGNSFTCPFQLERSADTVCLPFVVTVEGTWVLGHLDPGDYQFEVQATGQTVLAVPFQVGSAGERTVVGASPTPEGGLRFTVNGTQGVDYVIEATKDFQQWVPVSTHRGGPFEFTDPRPLPDAVQFYRVLIRP